MNDIEVLENYIYGKKETMKEQLVKATENLLKENKDLQKSIDQIYDDYQDIGKMYFNLTEKIEKMLEEYKKQYNKIVNEVNEQGIIDQLIDFKEISAKIQVLEELLEVRVSASANTRIFELEQENKSKQKAYDDCYCEYKHYKQFDSIPISLIKEKKKEIREKAEMCNSIELLIYAEIDKVLEELLKGKM